MSTDVGMKYKAVPIPSGVVARNNDSMEDQHSAAGFTTRAKATDGLNNSSVPKPTSRWGAIGVDQPLAKGIDNSS